MEKKREKHTAASQATAAIAFTVPETALDSTLASLFASSSGPIVAPKRSIAVAKETLEREPAARKNSIDEIEAQDDARRLSTSSSEIGDLANASSLGALRKEENTSRRKRRKIKHVDDLENAYLNRLAHEDAREDARHKSRALSKRNIFDAENEEEMTSSGDESVIQTSALPINDNDVFVHESLAKSRPSVEMDKSTRTVFLGNVCTSAIKSKSAKRTLLHHLSNVVADLPAHNPSHKVESLRFRSTAFVSGAGPKRAAFAKGELMDQTTKSTNAYVVYSTELAAQKAAIKLNGSVVLDRHLRADSLAVPTKIVHRRCVFVGNLSFVDEETVDPIKNDEHSERRAMAKLPADAEEGLWRAFGKAGKVESVRVVRDKETRVGKGFAYVQFCNENAVEAALLMNEKKFPPMLPRKLRVMRAKRTKQKSAAVAGSNQHSVMDPRKRKFTRPGEQYANRSGATGRGGLGSKKQEGPVFEGHRASKPSSSQHVASKHRKRHVVKPTTRSSRRGTAFKKAGGKRDRGTS